MRKTSFLILAFSMSAATALAAQVPGRGPGAPGGPVANAAGFLLARTGELKLTDAQVTRLAAIARRSEDRRRALGARLDSLRPRDPAAPNDSAARSARMRIAERMRPIMEREREHDRTDLRDAITVLTADQQASAWAMVAGGFARAGGPGGMGSRGIGRGGSAGSRPDRFAPRGDRERGRRGGPAGPDGAREQSRPPQ